MATDALIALVVLAVGRDVFANASRRGEVSRDLGESRKDALHAVVARTPKPRNATPFSCGIELTVRARHLG
ncbi:MAG TPA: hypothetical protein VK524_08830, partial [Polyangiaceae bacterium]|nr:hypothetical protein [Polyangiaceae bacterium]